MKTSSENLKTIVRKLSEDIGSRSSEQIGALNDAADYIRMWFEKIGYTVTEQVYTYNNNKYRNLVAELKGRDPDKGTIVVGAHYDTVADTPGADDNASGIAGLIELARAFYGEVVDRNIRFVAFTLEEPPLFATDYMGSSVYAKSLKEAGENITAMVCLEMIGYFDDMPASQLFPLPLMEFVYPNTGNFIAIVGNSRSKHLLNELKQEFEKHTTIMVESLAAPIYVPGTDLSDHRSFWKENYNAVMITDTAFFRNPYYHEKGDTAQTLNYEKMAEVIRGLFYALKHVADH